MAEKYPGEEVSEQLDSSIESSASSCSSCASSRASSPDMLHSSLQEHLDSSNNPKGRTKTDPKGQTKIATKGQTKTTNDPKGPINATKGQSIVPKGQSIVPKGQSIDPKGLTTTEPKEQTKITVDPEGRKTRVQDLKLKAKMLGIKGYSKLNKKQLEIVLSNPDAAQHPIVPKAHAEPQVEPQAQEVEPQAQEVEPQAQEVEPKAHDPNAHIALEKLSKMNLNELKALNVASRYKECEPLTDKTAANTAAAIAKIYGRDVLTYPNIIQVDSGNEFKGEFAELMKTYETKIKVVPPGNHNTQGIVERFNKTLAMRLFTVQYQKELKELYKSGDENREWVKALPNIITDLNNTYTRLIKLAPAEAITRPYVSAIPSKPLKAEQRVEEVIPTGSKVRYLYRPGELYEGQERRRATDPVWSLTLHQILEKMVPTDAKGKYDPSKGPILYKLTNDVFDPSKSPPSRRFVRQELLLVPDDTDDFVDIDRLSDEPPELPLRVTPMTRRRQTVLQHEPSA
ncbi:hypothetical protein EMCRGX_G009283 [Ephydatia muelleri]